MDISLGVPTILIDVPNEAVDGFGPLKTVLGVISTVCLNDQVR
jgi:hypothetical protein